jgi:hypothetical protein
MEAGSKPEPGNYQRAVRRNRCLGQECVGGRHDGQRRGRRWHSRRVHRAGASTGYRSLILHWNGKAWTRVSSPGMQSSLSGVSALSSRSAWAVGGSNTKSLMLRWIGKSWKRVASPGPGGPDGPVVDGSQAVAVASARSAWAVGDTYKFPAAFKSVIWHWNGSSWKEASIPDSGVGLLTGVAAISASDVWAVGQSSVASPGR